MVDIEGAGKDMRSRQIDKKGTKQVRIDAGVHRLLKIAAARRGETIRSIVEGCLVELLSVKEKGNDQSGSD